MSTDSAPCDRGTRCPWWEHCRDHLITCTAFRQYVRSPVGEFDAGARGHDLRPLKELAHDEHE